MDLFERVVELARCGYHCSQIVVMLTLETVGEENPQLVRAMNALGAGVGYSLDCCGCKTGGACALGYFMGKLEPEEVESPEYHAALKEFTDWFAERTSDCGGTACAKITGGSRARMVEYCPALIAETYEKCMELLSNEGIIG